MSERKGEARRRPGVVTRLMRGVQDKARRLRSLTPTSGLPPVPGGRPPGDKDKRRGDGDRS